MFVTVVWRNVVLVWTPFLGVKVFVHEVRRVEMGAVAVRLALVIIVSRKSYWELYFLNWDV